MYDSSIINVQQIYIKGVPLLDKNGKINNCFLPKRENKCKENIIIKEILRNEYSYFKFD